MATIIESDFIGQFIVGDNINYNLNMLRDLYGCRKLDAKVSLNKPITLTIVSVIEAVLYDLFWRISEFTIEGVEGIKDETIGILGTKHLDSLGRFVTHCKNHELLGPSGDGIYEDLEKLRHIRNRIHIQNDKGEEPLRERDLFTSENLILGEKTLEHVLKIMTTRHARDADKHYVDNFVVPWDAHLNWPDKVRIPIATRSFQRRVERIFCHRPTRR